MTTLRMLLFKVDHLASKLDSCEHNVELSSAGLALLANTALAAVPSMPLLSLLGAENERNVEQAIAKLEALQAPISAASQESATKQSNVAELTANYEAPVSSVTK